MTARRPSQLFVGDAGGAWNDELPGSTIELVFELGGHGWELDIEGRRTQVRAFAAGLVAGRVRSRPLGPVRLVQLAIDPFALPALLGVPAGAIAESAYELSDLAGRPIDELLERLGELDDRDLVNAADRWVAETMARSLADRGPRVPADVQRAVALIQGTGGTKRVEAIAAELGCSRRHLARRFEEWVGVSPSELSRLVRFEATTQALRGRPSQPLGALAHERGYADHAHMVRDFQRLAGKTPTAVAQRFLAA